MIADYGTSANYDTGLAVQIEDAVEIHLRNVKDVIGAIIRAPTAPEAGDLWVEAKRTEMLCSFPRSHWRDRVIHLYRLNTKLRRYKDLLRRFAGSYRGIRNLCLRVNYVLSLNIASRIEAFEVATFLEMAKDHGASEDTLHLLRSRFQYRPMF